MYIEDAGGTVLADSTAIHLASFTPEQNRLASWLCHYHLAEDPFPTQGARNNKDVTIPPQALGIGIEPNIESLGNPFAMWELK